MFLLIPKAKSLYPTENLRTILREFGQKGNIGYANVPVSWQKTTRLLECPIAEWFWFITMSSGKKN
jgi:hypothetical protein